MTWWLFGVRDRKITIRPFLDFSAALDYLAERKTVGAYQIAEERGFDNPKDLPRVRIVFDSRGKILGAAAAKPGDYTKHRIEVNGKKYKPEYMSIKKRALIRKIFNYSRVYQLYPRSKITRKWIGREKRWGAYVMFLPLPPLENFDLDPVDRYRGPWTSESSGYDSSDSSYASDSAPTAYKLTMGL